MKQQQVYNLKEFAAKYQLKDIFGGTHHSVDIMAHSDQFVNHGRADKTRRARHYYIQRLNVSLFFTISLLIYHNFIIP